MAKGVPTILLAGTLGQGHEELYNHGIAGIVCIADRPMNFDQSLRRTGELLEAAAHRAMRLIGVGRGMGAEVITGKPGLEAGPGEPR